MMYGKCSLMVHQEPAQRARLLLEWVIFVSPENHVLPRALSLTEPYSNNIAEYNALLIGLQLAQQIKVRYLEAYGDSKLIIN